MFAHVTQFAYGRYVSHLSERDAVTREFFDKSHLSKNYVLDTSLVYQNGWPNPNHIFELFGQLSGHSASNVRFLLLSDIAADVQFYQRTSFVCLEMRNTSFNQWITNLSLEEMYADELTLFSLSWLYKQHTVVITKNKLWSTLHSNSPVNEEALLDVCSVKLVYLGQLRFGTLWPKMAVPDFVMVPVAAGGPTKPTTSYQSMQSQPVSKPSTVSVPKSKTVPGTGISIVKGEKTAADEPLPVETLPASNESNTNLSAKNTENVETKGSKHVTEYVATETDAVTSQVETAPHAQNTAHVETSPPEGISTHPPALLPKKPVAQLQNTLPVRHWHVHLAQVKMVP